MRFRLSIRLAALAVLVIAALATTAALVTVGDANAKGVLASFQTPGTYTWTVPAGVEQVQFDAYGAAGGAGGGAQALTGLPPTDPGGLGGQVSAVVNVWPGQKFVLTVGGKGETFCQVLSSPGACGGPTRGGFNGGGTALQSGGGGGGGSSDVRAGMCALDPSATCRDSTRIVVAGGGGGGGESTHDAPTCAGGAGGGVVGLPGGCSGGSGGAQADPCPVVSSTGAGGGGGGGWCVGGVGTYGIDIGVNVGFTAGGGGSSWVVVWAAGPLTFNTGVQSGDGKIVITATK